MRFEQNLRSSAVVGEADFCAVMRESVSTHSLKLGVNESAPYATETARNKKMHICCNTVSHFL
jgi:hypothetical protein